jgi:hypothetical protein
MSYECEKCGSPTRMQVLVGISAPGALSHQFSKQNLRNKEVWLTHVNWETADYICTNPKCGHVTNGYGNYVTRLEAENKALRESANKLLDALALKQYATTPPEVWPDIAPAANALSDILNAIRLGKDDE